MTALVNMKSIGGGFQNEHLFARARYSFTDDGGATGAYPMFTAKTDLVIHAVTLFVKTAVTSDGSALCSFGPSADNDLFIDSIAKATLVANYVCSPLLVEGTPNTVVVPKYIASGDTLDFAIEAAALTAGEVWIEVEYSGMF